eukprot:scaffold1464_cov242-Chaetoceros_neogracile.AAC.4
MIRQWRAKFRSAFLALRNYLQVDQYRRSSVSFSSSWLPLSVDSSVASEVSFSFSRTAQLPPGRSIS